MSWYVYGAVCLAVGVLFRFVPLLPAESRWRPLVLLIGIPFAGAPNSWIPWGLALVLFGVAQNAPTTNAWAPIALTLAVILFLVGAVFLFWPPSWIESRSLREYERARAARAEGGDNQG